MCVWREKSRLTAVEHLVVEQNAPSNVSLVLLHDNHHFVLFSLLVLSPTLSCHWFVIRLWSPVPCQPLMSLFLYTVTNLLVFHALF